MTRRKVIPHCRLIPASSIRSGMMICTSYTVAKRPLFSFAEKVAEASVGTVRMFYPGGLRGHNRSITFRRDQLVLVHITNRAPRRGKTQ